jgi:uncharacterized protein YjbI with pentapeptide repeats
MSWTGFPDKTLWDWLDLLIVPLALGVGGFLLKRALQQGQERRAEDRRRQQDLDEYFERMGELILTHRLAEPESGEAVRHLARARTLSALRNFDGRQKAQAVLFLLGARLIQGGFHRPGHHARGVISMHGADLDEIELAGAGLHGIDLSGAILRRANLRGAVLDGANLSHAKLADADMTGLDVEWIDLTYADLTGADLRGSRLAGAYLAGAKPEVAELRGAHIARLD